MEEFELTESPGFFSRIFGRKRDEDFEEEDVDVEYQHPTRSATRASSRMDVVRVHDRGYTVCLRREIRTFGDAIACAESFKAGNQQLLNLNETQPGLRTKIEDFLAGLAFGLEGKFEPIGPGVFVLAPHTALVDVVSASEPMSNAYGQAPEWGD